MGSNMAEAHPVGFQWVMEAKANDATVIHVDPRFTRTSALSDLHVPLRVGTDIAFLGAVINYILSNELDFREYVLAYTNASFLISEDYQDTEDLDGLFSGRSSRPSPRSGWSSRTPRSGLARRRGSGRRRWETGRRRGRRP
jgi:formate dehydrogenase major subunit